MREILIISCSATKRNDAGTLPAVLRYNGPLFKVLRKQPPNIAGVFILSALYGLIPANQPIEDYDQRIALRFGDPEWLQWREEKILRPAYKIGREYDSVALCMGADYHAALGTEDFARRVVADGGRVLRVPPSKQSIGKMAAALKAYCLERYQPGVTPVWWPEP